MCFEYKIDALLEKEADFCKELINLIYSSDCELKDLALDDNTQNRIITKLNQNEEAWEALLSVLSPSYISDDIIEFLIKNKIALTTLCHMDLKNKWLLKLIPLDDAPVYTIATRYYLSETCLPNEFKEFYNLHLNKYNYISIHLLELYKNAPNRALLKYLCFNDSNFSEKEALHQHIVADKAMYETDEKEIHNIYSTYSDVGVVMLSIAKNYFTPEDILKELSVIKKVKFASEIRQLSKENLKLRGVA